MSELLDFHGPNAGYVLELFERYQKDPASVDAETRALFDSGLTPPPVETAVASSAPEPQAPTASAVATAHPKPKVPSPAPAACCPSSWS